MTHLSLVSSMLVCLLLCKGSVCLSQDRLCVIANRVANQSVLLAFRVTTQSEPVAVLFSYRNAQSSTADWSPWTNIGAPIASLPISNPACDYTDKNQTQLFVQASDGQVYSLTQDQQSFLKFSSWKKVGTNEIPSEPIQGALVDPVSVAWYGKNLMVFARSKSGNSSMLYWCRGNSTGFGAWSLLAGSTILGTDATFIKNPFTGKYEAFMLSTGGKMHRTWQHNEKAFAGWRTMDFGPSFSTEARPAAHVMGYSIFNGKLMVAGVGTDGYVHRVGQTTCDKVDNPWSYCTWGAWYKVAGKIPFSHGGVKNNLALSRNVHFGVEIFIVDNPGQLWQAWQLERGDSFHDWTKVPQDLKMASLASLPYFRLNEGGWWMAYALNATNQVVMIEPARSLNATPSWVAWGKNLTVSWSVSVDEATQRDWIGIFPKGAKNDQYVDYRYVQGGLNPTKDPVAVGNLSMASFLPDGSYNVRYLVNSNYVSILNTSVSYFNMSSESDLLQLYRGLFLGLGAVDKGIEQCVDEAALTIEKFQQAFVAFENRKIFKGLELLGIALEDVAKTLRRCEKSALANKLEKFIKDLISCTEDNCTSFVIDVLVEILILYEEEYEIYGDILGASNSFHLDAYQQGGLCIGRLVGACLDLAHPHRFIPRTIQRGGH